MHIRVYKRTYDAWLEFCKEQGISETAISFEHIGDFIHSGQLTKTTRQNRLSHMRKAARVLANLSGDDRARRKFESLSLLKVRSQTTAATKERSKTALNPAHMDKLLRVWKNDSCPLGLRNNAMIRLLAFTGVRRSELVSLQWRDVDLERGVIHIRL